MSTAEGETFSSTGIKLQKYFGPPVLHPRNEDPDQLWAQTPLLGGKPPWDCFPKGSPKAELPGLEFCTDSICTGLLTEINIIKKNIWMFSHPHTAPALSADLLLSEFIAL